MQQSILAIKTIHYRSWALYHATLIVWSYIYTLHSPIAPTNQLRIDDDSVNSAYIQAFLKITVEDAMLENIWKILDRIRA